MANFALIAPLGLNLSPLIYSVESSIKIGDIVDIEVRKNAAQGLVLGFAPPPNFKCKNATKSAFFFLPHQRQMAEFISRYYIAPKGLSYCLFSPFLEKDFAPKSLEINNLKPLSIAQKNALSFIKNTKNPLLFGDTGSGKTEIYIHLIAEILARGESAIFLMPEISLTPQMESRLRAVFGKALAMWHSKVTPSKKKKILDGIYRGEIRLIAGARSATFLPLKNLGAIIIDEEHDDAYKSNARPHFNARDVALWLGAKSNIKVVLGSATPSVNSYFNAQKNNALFRLKGQFFESQKSVEFIESSDEFEIHSALLNAVRKSISAHRQGIIFLPTRAHFKMLLCRGCGEAVRCSNCAVSMSLHLKKGRAFLACHYCGAVKDVPSVCPACGESDFSSQRIGTAQFAQMLESALAPSLRAVSEANGVAIHNNERPTSRHCETSRSEVEPRSINSTELRRHAKTPLENPQVDCHDFARCAKSRNDDSNARPTPSLRASHAVASEPRSINSTELRRHAKTPLENSQVDCHDFARCAKSRNDGVGDGTRTACNDDSNARSAIACNDDSKPTIALFDRDNITTQKKLESVLEKFNAGAIDLLVGTQMLSKGHDYHGVGLSAILGVDYLMAGVDFRSVEKAVALIHQIAGRAGRKGVGKVIIQTRHRDFLAQFLGDYELFLKHEIAHRPRLYPPFCRLAIICVSHKNKEVAQQEVAKILEILENIIGGKSGICGDFRICGAENCGDSKIHNTENAAPLNVEIVGSAPALIEKLFNKFRFLILLRSTSPKALNTALTRLDATYKSEHYYIDIDPLNIV